MRAEPFANSTSTRFIQFLNAYSPISYTELGITILVISVCPANAYDEISVIPAGIVNVPSSLPYTFLIAVPATFTIALLVLVSTFKLGLPAAIACSLTAQL